MSIHLFVLDYRGLPASVRDKVAVPEADAQRVLARLAASPVLSETVLLVTCHRCEVYVAAFDPAQAAAWVQTVFSGDIPPLAWRHAAGPDAVHHLCRVACGLDSSVLGEAQVLGQVRRAWAGAVAAGTAGRLLNRLFQVALSAGKRARLVGLGGRRESLAEVALHLATRHLGDLDSRRALVIGSGRMAGTVVRALRGRGVREVVVAARRPERAAALGAPVISAPLSRLREELVDADIGISATSASFAVIDAQTVKQVMARRRHPLILVDLAVPRDIDPAVRGIEGVTLFDADDVAAHASEIITPPAGVVQRAEAVAAASTAAFERWERARTCAPSIARLRFRAEQIQRAQVEKALRRLPNLTERERAVVERMAAAIVNRMLHVPIVRLKAEGTNGGGELLHQAFDALFDLDGERA